MLGDLEAGVETLEATNLALEGQMADLGQALERSGKALPTAEAQVASKNRKIEKLVTQLADRDATAQSGRDCCHSVEGVELRAGPPRLQRGGHDRPDR